MYTANMRVVVSYSIFSNLRFSKDNYKFSMFTVFYFSKLSTEHTLV